VAPVVFLEVRMMLLHKSLDSALWIDGFNAAHHWSGVLGKMLIGNQ
jgi:hypothetical protein